MNPPKLNITRANHAKVEFICIPCKVMKALGSKRATKTCGLVWPFCLKSSWKFARQCLHAEREPPIVGIWVCKDTLQHWMADFNLGIGRVSSQKQTQNLHRDSSSGHGVSFSLDCAGSFRLLLNGYDFDSQTNSNFHSTSK